MGKKSPPPAPNYTAAAEKTAEGNINQVNSQTAANRPNIYTPWGSQTWSSSAGVDPSTGKPVTNWESNISLTPDQQQALNDQMGIQRLLSQGASTLAGNAVSSFQSPSGWDSLPSMGDWRQRAQDAVISLQQPGLDRQRELTESQLANQGISRGSEAWNEAQQQLSDNENRAGLSAIASGRDEAQLSNRMRQQAISEMLQQRNQPLNELNALLTGQQVSSPQMPSFSQASRAAGPDYSGAAVNQYGASLDAFNARQGALGGLTNGLFSLGSAAIGNPTGLSGLFSLSDQRLKRDITVLFTLPNGVEVCSYRFLGKDTFELGCIAQQVREIIPDAVAADANGVLHVNYNLVLS